MLAYTMGNKEGYDTDLDRLARGEIPKLHKIGRCVLDNGEYYEGGCCWPTYEEAKQYIEKHQDNIPYTPSVYGILLPNSWEADTSDDSYTKEGFYSLLVNAPLVRVDEQGQIINGS